MGHCYLLQENGSRILLEYGNDPTKLHGGIVIGDGCERTGPDIGPGHTKQVGVPLGTSPQNRLLPREQLPYVLRIGGKILVTAIHRIRGLVLASPKMELLTANVHSKIVTKESSNILSSLVHQEFLNTKSTVQVPEESATIQGNVYSVVNEQKKRLKLLEDKLFKKYYEEKGAKVEKIMKLMMMLKLLDDGVNYEAEVPSINIDLPGKTVAQGELLRISANVDQHVSQLWLRILGRGGVIVQKAGLVKRNTSGFQILIPTQHLDKAIYTIQVADNNKFANASVAQIEIVHDSPLTPLILIDPSTIGPDKIEQMITFRTMLDSRVDAKCRPLEGKKYKLSDKNKPVIPVHWGCRCFYELE